MDAFVGYAREYELVIYAILGVFALWHVRQFVKSWDALRGAAFGIERDLAQRKLNQAASMLVLTLVIFVAQFSIVAYFAPALPGAMPLPTTTLDLESTALPPIENTPVPTMPSQETLPENITPTLAATPLPTAGFEGSSVCIEGQVMIAAPVDGSEVTGVVTLMGSANLENFGFYKYEVARPGDTVWLSINASDQPVEDGQLGEWITTALPPGDYLLRLVVVDNQGLALAPCIVRVRVLAPTPEP